MNRRLLAISWAMPPLVFPRALQVSRLLKQLSILGWDVTVISVDPASVQRGVLMDPALERFYTGVLNNIQVSSPEQNVALRVLYKCIPALRQIPDEQRVWVPRAVRAAEKLIAQNKFAAMISFAQPWSSHSVGYRLQRITQLPWVAHFSDPWTQSPYRPKSGWAYTRSAALETQIMGAADRLVFVNDETAQLSLKNHPAAWKVKSSVIPHGYDADLNRQLPSKTLTWNGLRLIHAGNFYDRRSPMPLLNALARLNSRQSLTGRLEMVFVGGVPASYIQAAKDLGLEAITRFLGPKNYFDTLEAMQGSDVLVLIDMPGSGVSPFFPSKLVDCLSFKKPILGLTPSGSLSSVLLQKLECPTLEPEDIEGLMRVISDLLSQKHQGHLKVSEAYLTGMRPYDIQQVALSFHTLLGSLIGI